MQISIDSIQAEYLLNILKNETWWCATKLISSIETGFKIENERKNCKHKQGSYTGRRTCCVKCGGYSEGDGESWTLKKNDRWNNVL
jgi:hypothetical protein